MVDLTNLSVDASQVTDHAKRVFEREGILVVKGLLPSQVVRTVPATFLRDPPEGGRRGAPAVWFLRCTTPTPPRASRLDGGVSADLDGTPQAHVPRSLPARGTPRRAAAGNSPVPEHPSAAFRLAVDASALCPYATDGPICAAALLAGSLHCTRTSATIANGRFLRRVGAARADRSGVRRHGGLARTHHAREMVAERRHVAADGWLPPIEAVRPTASCRPGTPGCR